MVLLYCVRCTYKYRESLLEEPNIGVSIGSMSQSIAINWFSVSFSFGTCTLNYDLYPYRVQHRKQVFL
jgi:hypothetical protein